MGFRVVAPDMMGYGGTVSHPVISRTGMHRPTAALVLIIGGIIQEKRLAITISGGPTHSI